MEWLCTDADAKSVRCRSDADVDADAESKMQVQWDCLQHIGCGRGFHDGAFGLSGLQLRGRALKRRQTQCHN